MYIQFYVKNSNRQILSFQKVYLFKKNVLGHESQLIYYSNFLCKYVVETSYLWFLVKKCIQTI
jgi:hypothetical protein